MNKPLSNKVTKSPDARKKRVEAKQRDEKRLKKQERLWIKSEREDKNTSRLWIMKDDEYLF
jgi:hypothetical protein